MSEFDPHRVQAVFLLAVEARDRAAREALLERECGAETELRRRVEELLAAHERSGSFLNGPIAPPAFAADHASNVDAGASPAETGVHVAALAPGALVAGRYRLLELIGEGGMGTVWKTEQREPVKRLVALKLIKLGMDSRHVLSRFEAERQALALMDHPNIAKVFDGGATGQGRPFFLMEYVKGVPITDY